MVAGLKILLSEFLAFLPCKISNTNMAKNPGETPYFVVIAGSLKLNISCQFGHSGIHADLSRNDSNNDSF